MTVDTDKPLLVAENLVKAYRGRRVVDGVNFTIRPREVVGLLGPNGAGKTTSFYMIVGLVKADAGRVLFQGEDVTRLPMYRRARLGMGYLAQEPSIFRRMTVAENVMCILETLDLSRRERAERLDHLLARLGLTERAQQRAASSK